MIFSDRNCGKVAKLDQQQKVEIKKIIVNFTGS